MKSLYLHLLFAFTGSASFSQINKTDYEKLLQQKEDSLKSISEKIINASNPAERLTCDSLFTKMLVRSLKIKNSFHFPFDSLYSISRLYAPDSSFRIFTWQMIINDNVIRQHGAIQMKTVDGSLKLFPLIDKSDITDNMSDTIANNLGWIGAVYYKIVLTKNQGNSYYTLLGYDENNIRSNKKIIEILTLKNGEPIFGNQLFRIVSGYGYNNKMARFILEFKKDASPRLTFDADLNMIIFEHLISESNEPNKKWTLVGDGDYEGFKWLNGNWVYVNKIFNTVTSEGNVPMPEPIRNNAGKIDESKLKGKEKKGSGNKQIMKNQNPF